MIYVLMMTNSPDDADKGMPTCVTLVGPFASQSDAAAWGNNDANIPDDDPYNDPYWHIVDLDEPAFVMQSVP